MIRLHTPRALLTQALVCLALLALPSYLSAQGVTQQVRLANEYYGRGEIEKAKEIYQGLSRRTENIPLIHTNYFNLLMASGYYADAESYIKQARRAYPNSLVYQIDQGLLIEKTEGKPASESFFTVLIEELGKNPGSVSNAARQFVQKQRSDLAIALYKEARRTMRDSRMFSLELASVYRYRNEIDKMIEEYLNYLDNGSSNNLSYIENILQSVLKEEKDLLNLEQMLYEKVQQQPGNRQYSELLVWTLLQQKQFYSAFLQARAIDRRFGLDGDKTMSVGSIALKNEDWETAKKIFEDVIERYPGTLNNIRATHFLIQTREAIVRNQFPVNTDEVRKLVQDYNSFIQEITIRHEMAQDALRSQAILHAFYLDNTDTAQILLQQLLDFPMIDSKLRGQAKLDLGDVYLLKGEPWESTLLYSQVEKEFKDSPLAYTAKLKNAKLSFYKGEFLLSQEHLDVLKEATTREIANDAMSLGLLIRDNIVMDSTEAAMRRFAEIDLLLFQNKYAEALEGFTAMLAEFPDHSLTDEIWWKQADIYRKLGEFETALALLDNIVTQHGYDILSDDAYFLMGQIYERQLKDTVKAQEIYQDFLLKYPGSIFTSEARKRYRTLRGDLVN
ncbi:MAG: tetratricopeptide repeat protein [Bacteroidota bacterium]